jgi:hypothetical protein
MADTDWTGYVGMVTGIIGAVMGIAAYLRSNQIKKLDLRLELRKGLGDAHQALSTLRAVIESAANSRPRVQAMRGLSRSGNAAAWDQAVEADRADVDGLATLLRGENADFSVLSADQLESEIVAANRIKASLSTLIEKYRGALAADDEARRQRHQEVTAVTAAQMRPK